MSCTTTSGWCGVWPGRPGSSEVVKGNGYGLGLAELAGHLVDQGIQCLAVSQLEEALELRRCGLQGDIMLLAAAGAGRAGGGSAAEADPLHRLPAGALAAEEAARGLDCRGRAQLCVDTGFGRYGFPPGSRPSRSGEGPGCWTGCGLWAPTPT